MTKIELVDQAAENLQRLVAEAIKEEMPEGSNYVTGVWYVGKKVHLYSDGNIVLHSATPKLKKECDRLKVAELYRRQSNLQNELEEVNQQIKEAKQ